MRLRTGRPSDHDAYLAISLQTARHGEDGTGLYRDGALMGLIYSAPYLAIDSSFCITLEVDGAISGFAIGAPDTRRFEAELETAWWPGLRVRYPLTARGSAPTGQEDERRIEQIHAPRHTPEAVVGGWPAHMHLNLAPHAQGKGYGRQLVNTWLDVAAREGATAVHVGVNRLNLRGERFWMNNGFAPIALDPDAPGAASLWLGRDISSTSATPPR